MLQFGILLIALCKRKEKKNKKQHNKTTANKPKLEHKQHILLLGYQNPPAKQNTGQVY